MPPYAYRFQEVPDETHPVPDAFWRLPVKYDSAELLPGLCVPTKLSVAVTIWMDDLAAPKQCLADVDRTKPAAVDRVNLVLALIGLLNEPWRCAQSQTNRTAYFSPAVPDGELPADAADMHLRIRGFVERVRSRKGRARSSKDPELADVDELPMAAESARDAETLMDFDQERAREFVRACLEGKEPLEPGDETLGVRYVFVVQDPECCFARGLSNLVHHNEAYATSNGGRATNASRLAQLDAAGARKRAKTQEQGEAPAPAASSSSADAFTKPAMPWEGHRALTNHEAYLRIVHAFSPEAARNPLAQDARTLDTDYNPANPYKVFSLTNAVKKAPAKAFVRQRFLCQYLRGTTAFSPDTVETRLVFPLPDDAFEMRYPFSKQAVVWGAAFPWVEPPVPLVLGHDSTVETRAAANYDRALRLESDLRKQMGNAFSESSEGLSGKAIHFEEFCERTLHQLSQLKDPRERRAFRNRPELLEQAWNVLCHSSDANIQSVLRHFYQLDRESRADGRGPYSFFGDELGETMKDLGMEPLANFVLRMMDDAEHAFGAIAHHGTIFKMYMSALGVFEPNRTIKYNLIMYGTAGTSKSYVMRVVVDWMMCGTVAWEVQDFSAKAMQNDTNRNYVLIVMDELHDRVAGIDKGRKTGEGDPTWKAWLTSQRIQCARTTKNEATNKFVDGSTDKEMIGGLAAGMNYVPSQIVDSVVDRGHLVEVPEIERAGHSLMDLQIMMMLRETDPAFETRVGRSAKEAGALYQKVFGIVAIANMFVKMGLLEEPSMLVAAMGNSRQLAALKRGGASGGFSRKRNLMRASKVARTLTFVKGAVEVFCNRATCPLTEVEWRARRGETFGPKDFMMLQPFLCSNEQVSALSITMLLNQWCDPMQAYPLQQLFEHGNQGGLKYLEWVRANENTLREKMPYHDSVLVWVMPQASKRSLSTAAAAFELFPGASSLGVQATAPPYMYARFGPIPRGDRQAGSLVWRAAAYIAQLIENAGGQHMSVASIRGILSELLTTPFDAPLYELGSGKFTGRTMPMKVVRLDEATEHLEVLEYWVRMSYSDAQLNATARAVSALGHPHTRERRLLTMTQIMSRRHLRVNGEDVCLPQFLETIPLRRQPKAPWTVMNATDAPTAQSIEEEEGEEEGEKLLTVVREDVEMWELKRYLQRCGYCRETRTAEYDAALRAHSKSTTWDTLKHQKQRFAYSDKQVDKRVGLYPDWYIARYEREEQQRRSAPAEEQEGAEEEEEDEMARLQKQWLLGKPKPVAPVAAPAPPVVPAPQMEDFAIEEDEEEEEEDDDFVVPQ